MMPPKDLFEMFKLTWAEEYWLAKKRLDDYFGEFTKYEMLNAFGTTPDYTENSPDMARDEEEANLKASPVLPSKSV